MLSARLWFTSVALAAVATVATTLLPGSLSPVERAVAAQKAPVVCMTDEGYGRYRPCDSFYKTANPTWRAGDTCFTDEGNGRYRPCSAGYKA